MIKKGMTARALTTLSATDDYHRNIRDAAQKITEVSLRDSADSWVYVTQEVSGDTLWHLATDEGTMIVCRRRNDGQMEIA